MVAYNSTEHKTAYALIIPALNPDYRLLNLIEAIHNERPNMEIVVIDDGSDLLFQPLFDQIEDLEKCSLCRHPKNRGKGAALKTALAYIMEHFPHCPGIITADCDGQHSPKDILRIGNALEEHPDSLVLGTRNFSTNDVPFKSRYGNKITSRIFKAVTGQDCSDTQTGLRGFSSGLAEKAVEVLGERYEYETNFLLQAANWQIPFVELPVETIYHNENKGSHFRPFGDSTKIYGVILKFWIRSLTKQEKLQSSLRFSGASLLSFVIDIGLFTVLKTFLSPNLISPIFLATIIARLISGIFNFAINYKWVFKSRGSVSLQAIGYLLLFIVQMMLSGVLVSRLSFLQIPLPLVKTVIDLALFLCSYQVQRKLIFKTLNLKEGRV